MSEYISKKHLGKRLLVQRDEYSYAPITYEITVIEISPTGKMVRCKRAEDGGEYWTEYDYYKVIEILPAPTTAEQRRQKKIAAFKTASNRRKA